MDVQTYFFRRTNMNALGQPRSWTDHLLWHHAAHTVDLFQYQTGEDVAIANAVQGPIHPELGIAMDMSIQLRTAERRDLHPLAVASTTTARSGTFFRYICDNGTYIARYDDLVDRQGGADRRVQVAVSTNGIELQDREFVAAIREGREPNSSVASVLTATGCSASSSSSSPPRSDPDEQPRLRRVRQSGVMPRDPHTPDKFDVYTLVVLRRPPDAPEMSDAELHALQARHLAYRSELRRRGVIVVNGPFDEQSDASLRGMSIFACDAVEATRLSDGDPSVAAGRLGYDVMQWWVAAGSLAFPLADGFLGDRRSMPDD